MSSLGNKKIMAANIQRLMDEQGKDRNDVCRDLGFRYTTFTDWVKGNTYPRIDKIEQMANYFHITKADLIEEPAPSTAQDMLLSEDEKTLVRGYRAASSDRREDMLDLARKALKSKEGVTSSSSRVVGEETA